VEVPTGRPAVGAGELLDVRAGHVVIAERVDMHNTSFGEESPVEGACDLFDFYLARPPKDRAVQAAGVTAG